MRKFIFFGAFAFLGFSFVFANDLETNLLNNYDKVDDILLLKPAEWYWYYICGEELGTYSDTEFEAHLWAFIRWYENCGPGSGGPIV